MMVCKWEFVALYCITILCFCNGRGYDLYNIAMMTNIFVLINI